MKDAILTILTLLGGLGVFLIGIKHMSEGLQATASGCLRKLMSKPSNNMFVGVGHGALSTIIVQSSSIITVMLVSFVSSSILTLSQAFAVLIGSNIGTTATIWLLALVPNPQIFGFVGLTIGGAMYFFLNGERIHHIGLTLVGLGLIFLGFDFMSMGVAPVAQDPVIAKIFSFFAVDGILDVLPVALVAIFIAAIIQSSAATTALAMVFASQNVISSETAIAVLFGANIGTTATGWLAARGGTAAGRRTALANTLSNVLGSFVLLWFFPFFAKAGQAIFSTSNAMISIAVADTLFACCRAALFLPFIKQFCKLIERIIHQPEDEKPHLSSLKVGAKVAPVIACDQALCEVDFMKKSNLELLDCARKVLTGLTENDPRPEKHIVHREDILDNVQQEITEFLGSILSKRLPSDVAERARRLLRLSDELESVSDECATVLKVVKRLRDQRQKISAESTELILEVHDKITAFASDITPLIRSPRIQFDLPQLQSRSSALHEYIRECRRKQLGRVGAGDPQSPVRVHAELDIINAYERIRAYYLNCAETLAGSKK